MAYIKKLSSIYIKALLQNSVDFQYFWLIRVKRTFRTLSAKAESEYQTLTQLIIKKVRSKSDFS
jgi:hypothetical protein